MGRWGLWDCLGSRLSDSDKEGVMRPVVIRAGGRSAQRLLLTGCLILGVLGLDAVEAHAAAPSSLTGETFISHDVKGSTLTGTCPEDFNGTNGSFNFSVSGTAAGPFPGIFTESGSFTTSPTGEVGDFSSTFTIENAAGSVTVTGTKSLHPESDSVVSCFPGTGGSEVNGSVGATYRATIAGVGQDTGTATVSIDDDLFGSDTPLLFFNENFGSTGAVRQQCQHGGWKSFGTLFKNQGDCVSFFATGGKNPPSGSSLRRDATAAKGPRVRRGRSPFPSRQQHRQ